MENWQKTHDALKLLPLYDIPIIKPAKDEQKSVKRNIKRGNRFWRFFKKMIYYKPTTFIGTNLMVAALTVCVQNILNKPHTHPKPKKEPIVHQTNETHRGVSSDKIILTTDSLNGLMTPLITALTQNNTTVKFCEGCGDVIRYCTNSGKDANVTCLTCQKPFQEFTTNSVQQITRE